MQILFRLPQENHFGTADSDYGYVARAQRAIERQLHLPTGYTLKWSGGFEFQPRPRKHLSYILPTVFGAIFVPLRVLFDSAAPALMLLPCLFTRRC